MTHHRRFLPLLASALAAAAVPAFAQSSPSAFTYATRYDAARRVVGTIAPDPDGSGPRGHAATRNTYNAQGWLTSVETGELSSWPGDGLPSAWSGFSVHQTVVTVYDAGGAKIDERLYGGGTLRSLTQWKYDGAGRVVCTAVRMNLASPPAAGTDACALTTAGADGPDRITKTIYNPRGLVEQVRRAVGTSLEQAYTSFTYNTAGQAATLTDANGNRSAYSYDGFNRRTHFFFPSPTSAGATSSSDYEQYSHDAGGNRTQLRKRDGQVINYSYDAMGRMVLKDYADNNAARASDVYYGYDLRGLQTYARFGSTSGAGVTNSYDSLGRLAVSTSDVSGTGRALSYAYDRSGNLVELTWPDAVKASWSYDGLDRLAGVFEGAAASPSVQLASLSYDALGRRADMGRNGAATQYAYDGASRLTCVAHDLAGGGTASCAGGVAGDDQRLTFAHNPASQITIRTADNDAYAWTNHSNVTRPYTANGLNQYTVSGPRTLAYDANGNLAHDGAIAFTYDAENRLVGATGARTANLAYDPLGRLAQTSGGPSGTTQLLYDGDQLVAEYNGSGTLLRRYVHGPGVDDPVVWYEGSGLTDRRQLFANHQGSIVAVANASGAKIGIDAYGPFGEPAQQHLGRFGYTGQIWLSDLALWHYKARAYSPYLGRFMQTDPVGYEDQANLYAYVGNDPMNMTDPEGEESACVTLNTGCGVTHEPFTAEKLALTIEVVSIVVDMATGPTPDASIAGLTIGKGIREAAENRATSAAKGIPESKLGPSGKPKIHVVDHKSMKEAKDAATSRTAKGQAPAKHSNPKVGKPHYHATNSKGAKKQDGVHNTYPKKRSCPTGKRGEGGDC